MNYGTVTAELQNKKRNTGLTDAREGKMPASGADLRSSLRLSRFATEKPRSEWETLSRSRVLSDMKETGAPVGKSAGSIESREFPEQSNMVIMKSE